MSNNKFARIDAPDENEMKKLGEFMRKMKLDNFIALNRHAELNGVVFAGDSITEGFPVHELLRSARPLYNRGIGGDTTRGILEHLRHLVLDLAPLQVFLLIGTNDLVEGEAPSDIVLRIREICLAIRKALPQTQLTLLSIYPVNKEAEPDLPFPVVGVRTNEVIRLMNDEIRQMTVALGIDYLDLYARLSDEQGRLNKEYTTDGLHLSIAGYEQVKAEIQGRLK